MSSPAELELRRTLRHVRGFTYVVGAAALFILAGLALLNLLAYVELLEIAEGNRANGRAIRELVAEGDRRNCERLQQALDQIILLDPPVDLDCPSTRPGGSP